MGGQALKDRGDCDLRVALSGYFVLFLSGG